MKIKFVYTNNKLETWSGTFCHVNMRARVGRERERIGVVDGKKGPYDVSHRNVRYLRICFRL